MDAYNIGQLWLEESQHSILFQPLHLIWLTKSKKSVKNFDILLYCEVVQ